MNGSLTRADKKLCQVCGADSGLPKVQIRAESSGVAMCVDCLKQAIQLSEEPLECGTSKRTPKPQSTLFGTHERTEKCES